MTQAKSGDKVKVHYSGKLDDGAEFDSSAGRDPIEVTIGGGMVIPGFEDALVGMAAGDKKTVTIASAQAYGPHFAKNVAEVERSRIPDDIDLEIGTTLLATGAQGESLQLTVVAIGDNTVTLDANHPLAGKDLTFDLHLVEIVPEGA